MIEAKRVAEMIHVLPALIADEGLHPIARQACVETYFTSVRGLIEFLEVKPTTKKSDFSAKSIVPDWEPSLDESTKERLLGYWKDASKHTVHFTKLRAASLEEATVEMLKKISDDVLDVWDQYADAVNETRLAPHRPYFPKAEDYR
ncbi:UNVERIFIED_ORG: hypothetical protein FNL38_11166 [Nocardia globerula]|uniref:Uncharacterized protein n=1 Tax=Nocardia globerula TaxID=1818 RepID=A0A652YI48_NOCGL